MKIFWRIVMPAMLIEWAEKGILLAIGIFTLYAMGQEVYAMVLRHHVDLRDLLLMFIFAEVLGMVHVFYTSHELPIQFPLFIGMTSISRSIILEGGVENAGINLVYQGGAIFILSVATWVVKYSKKQT